jgi:N-6 DNA Methylase
MATLSRELRKELERAVKGARRAAEAGARKALGELGVPAADAPAQVTAEQRALRNKLRAHGRQLGDARSETNKTQGIERLTTECAYEHWHRMLFARFLAENELLIEPESQVAISLADVQEMARQQNVDWLPLASAFAQYMLPQIFRAGDPALEVSLPPETRSKLEEILNSLAGDVFTADDSLGWVYQYWQAEKKEEILTSEDKIGAEELPAVTQLFTEDYMVLFLLHNTLGAWWAARVLSNNPELAASARNEEELRNECRVGDVRWTFLRFVRLAREDGIEGPWQPAAGTFDGWPKAARDLTVLDPCMGSGHFLVFALPVLVAFRMAEESLTREAAVDAVLRDNLFGLEIDPRCTQIAAFNIAFAAWKSVGYRSLPQLNFACSGLSIGVAKAEWLRLAEKAVTAADPAAKRDLLGIERNLLTVGLEERVKNGLEALYDLFVKAPWLGSLIDPRRASADILREGFDKLEPLITSILSASNTDDVREIAVAAQGMTKAAELLSRRFDLVVTNVPFLGRGKQDDVIRSYVDQHFEEAKADLSTTMIERGIELCKASGSFAAVTPQTWLFLATYKAVRRKILRNDTLNFVVDLGPAAFNEMNWWAARTAIICITNDRSTDSQHLAVDADTGRDLAIKPQRLSSGPFASIDQADQIKNPDCVITVRPTGSGSLLQEYVRVYEGMSTGDNDRYRMYFWEIIESAGDWRKYLSTNVTDEHFGGRHYVVRWTSEQGPLSDQPGARVQGMGAWQDRGVLISVTGQLRAQIKDAYPHEKTTVALLAKNDEDLPAIYAFTRDKSYADSVRALNQKTGVSTGFIAKVPFDLEKWKLAARSQYPDGLPEPASDDPTQWLFHGNPASTTQSTALQVGVARMCGFRWPAEAEPTLELSAKSRSLLASIRRSDDDALINGDGIVCISATMGQAPAEQRLVAVLADAFGADWSAAKLASLLAEGGFTDKPLDEWLRADFFEQHCDLFHQRPYVWHIWDGRHDGFHALVNYHRLAAPAGGGRRTLEKLIYSYLGEWIDRQRTDQQAGVDGSDGRLAAAQHLKSELEKIRDGDPPYDIFARWKPLCEQPIGWEPDINDGVRINIRPFMNARPLGARSASSSILRVTPKIKWDKDRGKEPARDKDDNPWFWGWDETTSDFAGGRSFDGNRWNALHYSNAIKQAARNRKPALKGAQGGTR